MAVGATPAGVTNFFDILYPSQRDVALESTTSNSEISYYKHDNVVVVVDALNNLHVRIRNFAPLEKERMQTLVARTARAVERLYEHVKAEGIFNSFWVDICNLSQFDEVTLRSVVPREIVNPIFPPAQREGSPPVAEEEDEGEAVESAAEVGFVSFLSREKTVHFWEWTKRDEPCGIKVSFCDCLDENMNIERLLPSLCSQQQPAAPNHSLRYYFVDSLIKDQIKRLETIWGVDSMQLKVIHEYGEYYKRHNDPEGFLYYLETFEG